MSSARALVAPLLALGIAALLLHPLCNLLFSCGCDLFGPAHCNIHAAMSAHCPWCVHPPSFAIAGLVGVLGGAIGLMLTRRRGTLLQLCAALGCAFFFASASGYGAARHYRYPTFLGTNVP